MPAPVLPVHGEPRPALPLPLPRLFPGLLNLLFSPVIALIAPRTLKSVWLKQYFPFPAFSLWSWLEASAVQRLPSLLAALQPP